jgi:hypothetical protein
MFALRAALGRFRPDYVPSLIGWWDASAGNVFSATTGGSVVTVGNTDVRRWEDLSGNGYHMTGPANEARLQVGGAGRNGLPIIRRNYQEGPSGVSGDFALQTDWNTQGTTDDIFQPFTMIFAGKIGRVGDNGDGQVVGGITGAGYFIGGTRGGTSVLAVGSNATTQSISSNRYYVGVGNTRTSGLALNSENYVVMAVQINGGSSFISINNAAWTQINLGDDLDNYNLRNFGVLGGGSDLLLGAINAQEIAEICFYDEVLSDADRISVVGHLMDKWAIS